MHPLGWAAKFAAEIRLLPDCVTVIAGIHSNAEVRSCLFAQPEAHRFNTPTVTVQTLINSCNVAFDKYSKLS